MVAQSQIRLPIRDSGRTQHIWIDHESTLTSVRRKLKQQLGPTADGFLNLSMSVVWDTLFYIETGFWKCQVLK
jgi:hypothetical protein